MLKFLLLLTILTVVLSQKTCVNVLSDAQRAEIVRAHNYYRNLVASGKQGSLPTATNMKEVTWDKEVEGVAQNWASSNPSGHNSNRKLPTRPSLYVGENIYWSSRSGSKVITAGNANVTAAIASWYSEVKDFSGDVSAFKSSAAAIGHFTQVIWADTSAVGCGILDCVTKSSSGSYSQSVAFVCDYAVGGNYLGSPIYKKGAVTSACGTKGVSKTFPALCAA